MMPTRTRPEEVKKESIKKIFKEILLSDICDMTPDSIVIKESVDKSVSEVTCSYSHSGTNKKLKCAGDGVVDALFSGLCAANSKKYKSLNRIRFSNFVVKADFDTKKTQSGSDSEALVLLETINERNQKMIFRQVGKSVNFSATRAVFEAVEFYINCELCFKKLVSLVEDAKARGRHDVASMYVGKLVDIIGVMTYETDD